MNNKNIKNIINKEYKEGFYTKIKQKFFSPGINHNTIKLLSKKKKEPNFMLEWRINAFEQWQKMKEPLWAKIKDYSIDYQSIIYHAEPHNTKKITSLKDIDPVILDTYNRLGIPLHEQENILGIKKNVAVDAVFDSVSLITTFKKKLNQQGIIFCSISEAIQLYPNIIQKYLGSVVPNNDNFFTSLNSSIFSDGSFVYIPENTKCPMELSTYFRINAIKTGQFERTLIIAKSNSEVSYLEGCSAPIRDENQLHAAVVELIAYDNAKIKYSTIQNWYPGNKDGIGGIYNFVTKRGLCKGYKSKISWSQVETGAAITWKYPSVILKGNNSIGEFYSVSVTKNKQQTDTGTKMIHIGNNTKSTIIAKGISTDNSSNTYRGLVAFNDKSNQSRNSSQCDSLLIGDNCSSHTYPHIINKTKNSIVEHEATTSKISDEQLFYCKQRGITQENAMLLIINGFCKDVFTKLPLEFAVEVQTLMEITLENSVG